MKRFPPQRSARAVRLAVLTICVIALASSAAAHGYASLPLSQDSLHAPDGSSEHYHLTAEVLAEGGGMAASGGYRLAGSIGSSVQPVTAVSAGYRLVSGPIPVLYPRGPQPNSNAITDPLDGAETMEESVTVRGQTAANAAVLLRVDGTSYAATAGADGSYTVAAVALVMGVNVIESISTDQYGDVATDSVSVTRTTYFEEGVLESRILDAGQSTTWQTISWQADVPTGTTLVFRTRTGNTATPDGAWSAWSDPPYTTSGAAITSPAGRYLQYEARFTTSIPTVTPVLHEVVVTHEPTQSAPVISRVRVANGRDTSFNVSWITDIPADGSVRYGTDPASLNSVAYDLRGQAFTDDTHCVTLSGLLPGTTYYFDITSGSTTDNNGGAHYQTVTGPILAPPCSDTIYGKVFKEDGTTFAAGAIVYARVRDKDGKGSPGVSAWLATLVDGDGYWYLNLCGARTQDLAAYFAYSATGDEVEIEVEGAADCAATVVLDTSNDSPAADISLACTVEATLPFGPGWNLIVLPIEPLAPFAAQSFLDAINSADGNPSTRECTEVDRWLNGGWDAHIDKLPFNSFPIEMGKGYFVKCTSAAALTYTGRALTSAVPLPLLPGWNLVGVPYPSDYYTVQSLLDAINAVDGNNSTRECTETDRWLNGGWDAHIDKLPFNNYPIEPDEGYFVKCTASVSFIPSSTAAAGGQEAWPAPVMPHANAAVESPIISEVLVTDRRDVALTVVWRTDQPSDGWVEYGATAELGSTAYDVRGQASVSTVHRVTLSGLLPESGIYFRVHSGSSVADQDGAPFEAATRATGAPGTPLSAYGQVTLGDGTPAVGSLVIARLTDGAGNQSEPLSALVDGWGWWVLSLPESDCDGRTLVLDVIGARGEGATLRQPACACQPAPALQLSGRAGQRLFLPILVQEME